MVRLDTLKFGDKLRTRDGRMAVFLHKSIVNHNVYMCAVEHDEWSHLVLNYRANGKRYFDNDPSGVDIVDKWEDEK